jgi:hypothetical protein
MELRPGEMAEHGEIGGPDLLSISLFYYKAIQLLSK